MTSLVRGRSQGFKRLDDTYSSESSWILRCRVGRTRYRLKATASEWTGSS